MSVGEGWTWVATSLSNKPPETANAADMERSRHQAESKHPFHRPCMVLHLGHTPWWFRDSHPCSVSLEVLPPRGALLCWPDCSSMPLFPRPFQPLTSSFPELPASSKTQPNRHPHEAFLQAELISLFPALFSTWYCSRTSRLVWLHFQVSVPISRDAPCLPDSCLYLGFAKHQQTLVKFNLQLGNWNHFRMPH